MRPIASEAQATVDVPAFGARHGVRRAGRRVQVVAANAVKGEPATARGEAGMIPAVIVGPKSEEAHREQEAEDDNAGHQVEHARSVKRVTPAGQARASRDQRGHKKGVPPERDALE